MKKLLAMVLGISILFTGSVFAGTTVRSEKQSTTTSSSQTSEELHRVAIGYAYNNLGNFWTNDWDTKSSQLTPAEIAYLKTLTRLSSDTVYIIDLTTKTVTTIPANNISSSNFYNNYCHPEPKLEFQGQTNTYGESFTIKDGVLTANTSTEQILNYLKTSYQVVFKAYDSSPVVIDLDNNRSIDTAFGIWTKHAPKFFSNYARFFDITGDGAVDYTEWTPSNVKDALLVKPENGKIESALQLFGTAGGYKDGYEKLSLTCDADKNGWVEGSELEGLALWQDMNSDGIFQASELKSLDTYGITAISTNHSNYVSSYKTNDGSLNISWDWWPAVSQLRKFE